MKSLSDRLNFRFRPHWAILTTLEKLLPYLDGESLPADQWLIDLLVIGPREHQRIAQRNTPKTSDCALRSSRVNIGVDGSVEHCCATYDSRWNVAADFLAISQSDIQRERYGSDLCAACMSKSLHGLYTRSGEAELCVLGNQVLAKLGSPVRLLPGRRVHLAAVQQEGSSEGIADDEPLSVLGQVYACRTDLQHTFPEAATGDFTRLWNWARAVANGDCEDGFHLLLQAFSDSFNKRTGPVVRLSS